MYETASYKLIYIFSIPDEAHKNMVKIGEATIHTTEGIADLLPNCESLRQAADKGRIKDYTFTAGIKVNLHWAELAIKIQEQEFEGQKVKIIQGFHDRDVHNVLKNSGISVKYPNGIKNREWFECDVETAKKAIKAVINGKSFLSEQEKSTVTENIPVIQFREEQNEAVKKTFEVYKKHDKMLWNCKMRFGKTLSAYELIRSGKYKKTIVVTHRPVVEDGWTEDHLKLFGKNSDHVFMKKQGKIYSEDYFDVSNDFKNDQALIKAKEGDESFTYFASMQDLRGSQIVGGKFDKNKAVFAMDWDLIIYDEAHEGTQTELGQRVQTLLESEKDGKKPKVLELSGTPYNIMDKYEDNVYTWDYVMEQEAKENWDAKHPGEPNPYADMPKMNIFTFDLSRALPTSYRYETETSAFNFREFFRVWTGDKEKDFAPIPQGKSIGDFVHEDDIKAFLRLITTDSEETKYPFATDEYRKEFKHTLWMLPGVKEARALSKLLRKDAVFSHYQVVNVAGEGDEEMPYDNALDIVKEAIAINPYTITLSCGKLTTGVTVREWTAVMMLTGANHTDAKGYMQTIFRVQTAGTVEGKQKENCYVFDFAPDRTLNVISDVYQITQKGSLSEERYKNELKKFINFCPIISVEGTKMVEYNVNQMVRQIKRISIDNAIKSGFDDESIYKVDTGIVMDDNDREFFAMLKNKLTGQKRAQQETGVVLAENGMSHEEYEKAKKAERKPKVELSPEDKEMLEKLKEQRKQRATFIALLRNISIRLPLLIYGADVPLTENLTLEKFIDIVDPESWQEFMPEDVTTDIFRRSIKYFDEDVLIAAGLRIRRLAKQADEYPPLERIKRITELFGHFRNPDKETVLTPWGVVNLHLTETIGGYTILDETFNTKNVLEKPRFVDRGQITKDVINENAKILEINSKSGVYPLYVAYSIFKKIVGEKESDMSVEDQYKIWNKVISENVFVLCKTKMAEYITQRTLAGFTDSKARTHYQPHLLENMKDNNDWVVKKLSNPTIWGIKGDKMKFDAIVGNPPYQGVNHSQIYPFFYLTSIKLSNNYVSLIFPTGWQEPKNANNLAKLNNEQIKTDRQIVYIDNRQNIFPGISGAEWVNILLWQKGSDNGLGGLQKIYIDGEEPVVRELAWEIKQIAKPKEISQIYSSVIMSGNFLPLQNEMSVSKPYGLRKDVFSRLEHYGLEEMYIDRQNPTDIKIYGSHGVVRYVPRDYKLPKKTAAFDKYKVLVGSAWGNMSEGSGLGGSYANIIIAKPFEICTETYQESGKFSTFDMARKHAKYLLTKFARALLYVNKVSQMSTTAWGAVPIQDFSEPWWDKSIKEIDDELMKKYDVPQHVIDFIYKNFQTKDESNIVNFTE